jgi:hypothetical protein
MRLALLLLACVPAILYSCKKTNENTPPPAGSEPAREVQLKLGGDLSIHESPLGKKINGVDQYARTLSDSTIYVVEVGVNNQSVYKGVFNRADSIFVPLPATRPVAIGVTAFKRGSGPGLYYTWDSNGRQYFPDRLMAPLTNRMENSSGSYLGGAGILPNIPVFNPADTTTYTTTVHSEVDSYTGETILTTAGAPSVINLSMRRLVFGIKFNAANFSSGRLIADFNGWMPNKYLTPSEAASNRYIYTADDFHWVETLGESAVDLTLKWEKTGGSIVVLGSKKMYFKRNVLTNINVTVPLDGSPVSIPLDSNWVSTEEANF